MPLCAECGEPITGVVALVDPILTVLGEVKPPPKPMHLNCKRIACLDLDELTDVQVARIQALASFGRRARGGELILPENVYINSGKNRKKYVQGKGFVPAPK